MFGKGWVVELFVEWGSVVEAGGGGGWRPVVVGYSSPLEECFYNRQMVAKFRLEKCDFHLYTGFFMEKKWSKFSRFWKRKIISNCKIYMISSSG